MPLIPNNQWVTAYKIALLKLDAKLSKDIKMKSCPIA
jgi:hypothetical protein